MAELRPGPGLLDTSVLVDPAASRWLPQEISISALSLAELAAGPHAAGGDVAERARRQERLQVIESTFDPLPFDAACARAYGRVFAAVAAAGRKARGRAVDLMIAATAIANELPLYTCNARDLRGLEPLLEIVDTAGG